MAMHTSGSVGASNGSTVPVEDAWSAFHVDVNTTRSENEANKGNHVPTEGTYLTYKCRYGTLM